MMATQLHSMILEYAQAVSHIFKALRFAIYKSNSGIASIK